MYPTTSHFQPADVLWNNKLKTALLLYVTPEMVADFSNRRAFPGRHREGKRGYPKKGQRLLGPESMDEPHIQTSAR